MKNLLFKLICIAVSIGVDRYRSGQYPFGTLPKIPAVEVPNGMTPATATLHLPDHSFSTDPNPFTPLKNLPASQVSNWPPHIHVLASCGQQDASWVNEQSSKGTFTRALTDQLSHNSSSIPAAYAEIVAQGGYENVWGRKQKPVSSLDSPFKADKPARRVLCSKKAQKLPNCSPNAWRKGENPKNLNVLLISGEAYSQYDDQLANRDLTDFELALRKSFPFIPSDQFHRLNDPTPKQIDSKLRKMEKITQGNKDAQYLVVYVGHVGTEPAPNKAEGDAMGYLATKGQFLSKQSFATMVEKRLPKRRQTVLVVDACGSGAFSALKRIF